MGTAVRVGRVTGVLGLLTFVEQGKNGKEFTCPFERIDCHNKNVRLIEMKWFSTKGIIPGMDIIFETDAEENVTLVRPLVFHTH